MSKLKKHSYADRLRYMQMLEQGYTCNYIHCKYGISSSLLKVLWTKYQVQGYKALIKTKNTKLSLSEKLAAIGEFEIKKLSLNDVLLKYNISATAFDKWRKQYHESGPEGLRSSKIGRPSKDMGRPKKKTVEEMTELERLRYENEYLKAENALLKKVRALVEERENRQRMIGRKPSKN
nr:unnamed protein product [uncultured bacterium]